jgi:ribose transport system permease protein
MTDHTITDRPAPATWLNLRQIPGVAVMLILMTAALAWTSPGFTTSGNVNNVLVQSVILLLIALPMTLIIMTEGIDLSMGAMLTLLTIVYAMVIVSTGSIALGLVVTLAAGVAFGFVNGWIIAVVGMPPFVVTLGTLGIAQGLSLILSDGQSIAGLPRAVEWTYSGTILGLPVPLYLAVASYGIMHWLLYHTKFGVCVPALGGNREALRQAGVNDNLALIGVYVLGGVFVAIAAPLLCARMSAAHPTAAFGMEFDAIAAVALGGTQFERGNGWLFGTVLGVLTIGILRNGLNLLAVPSSVQVACVGFLVILALFIDGLRSRRT